MIIASNETWKVGEIVVIPIYHNDRYGNAIRRSAPQPCVVVRKATFEEWVADCVYVCGEPPPNIRDEGYNYYRIESERRIEVKRQVTIQEWMDKIYSWAESKGWHDKPLVIEKELMNFQAEISEAWEELRKGKGLTEYYFATNEKPDFIDYAAAACGYKPEGFPVEIADLLIRIFHSCAYHKIDIEKYIELKMAYNETRSYRHGNKTA
jgi:NTP pyrophosphatase (non-canonical NTP hydrolase)